MKRLIAKLFRQLFQIEFFRTRFFGFHQHVFVPYRLFKDLVFRVNYDGFQLKLKIDDWIQENIYFLGVYEKAELKVLANHLKPCDVCLDIGANLGLYSLNASRIVGEKGKVISFEPFSINHKALQENIKLNHIINVTIEKLAVGNESGSLTLYHDESASNLGMVTANYIESATTEEVEIISIDTYVDKHSLSRVDFIKIDTEGFEYSALLGMKKTLQRFQPPILIEILDDQTDTNNEKVHDFLDQLGYKKYYIKDDGELSETSISQERQNYFFKVG